MSPGLTRWTVLAVGAVVAVAVGLVATHRATYNAGVNKGKMNKQIMARYVDPTEQLVIELSVGNLTRSVSFYRALGFDLLREEERFAVLAWEGHQLFLQQADHVPEPPATAVVNLRVMVPDVDQIWQRATELRLRSIVPIGDRRYGLRDFTIADPDGFEVRFATWLPPVRWGAVSS